MERPLRIEYPGALYHITNRGNEWQVIFKNKEDKTRFLEIIGGGRGDTGTEEVS